MTHSKLRVLFHAFGPWKEATSQDGMCAFDLRSGRVRGEPCHGCSQGYIDRGYHEVQVHTITYGYLRRIWGLRNVSLICNAPEAAQDH